MMAGFLRKLAGTRFDAMVEIDRVTITGKGSSGSASAPFSCGHLLIGDVDLFEEAIKTAFQDLALSSPLTFPIVSVTVSGRAIHPIEQKTIGAAFANAGAIEVELVRFDPCREREAERQAYVAQLLSNR